jgi:hypothetical protein
MITTDKTATKSGLPVVGASLIGMFAVILLVWLMHRHEAEVEPAAIIAASSAPEPANAVAVELSPHLNGALQRRWIPSSYDGDDLSALPRGPQVLGGVTFDVQGVIQLQGLEWKRRGHEFPERVDGIRVGRACNRLHLLHATGGFADPPGTTVAWLVLHYGDGTEEKLAIQQNVHVKDWWAWRPANLSDPNTVVAWTGQSPATAQKGISNRLFRTTFTNPQPGKRLDTIDYVSAMAGSGPFLVALTAE